MNTNAKEDFNPINTSEMPRSEKIKGRLWVLFQAVTFRMTLWFMHKIRVALVRFAGERGISKKAGLSRTCRLEYPWRISIGERSSIGERAWVYALDEITIGKKCCIGDGVKLISGSHDVRSRNFHLVTKPIMIGDCVWIATDATVLPGVSIGDGAVVGACSVVTKDVPSWSVVAGNPARVVNKRNFYCDFSQGGVNHSF